MLRRLGVASAAAVIISVLALGAPVAAAQGNPGGPGCGYGGRFRQRAGIGSQCFDGRLHTHGRTP